MNRSLRYAFSLSRPAALRTFRAAAAVASDRHTGKAVLLEHLQSRAYIKLAASDISGVGVIAIADIPAGINPFCAPNEHLLGKEASIWLTAREIASLPSAVAAQVLDFHAALDDPRDTSIRLRDVHGELVYGVNATGMTAMDHSWFVNHSAAANLEFTKAEGQDFNQFRTTKAVRAGEELTYDYAVYAPDMYERIMSGAGEVGVGRRERLEELLRAAQAKVDRLREELEEL